MLLLKTMTNKVPVWIMSRPLLNFLCSLGLPESLFCPLAALNAATDEKEEVVEKPTAPAPEVKEEVKQEKKG